MQVQGCLESWKRTVRADSAHADEQMLGHAAALHCRRLAAQAEVMPSLEAQRAFEDAASDDGSAARPLRCRLSYRHRVSLVEGDAGRRSVGQHLPGRGHEMKHVIGVELGVEAGFVVGFESELANTLVVAGVAGVEAELRLLGGGGRGWGWGWVRGGGGVWLGAAWGPGYTLQARGGAVIRRARLRARLELAEVVERLLQQQPR